MVKHRLITDFLREIRRNKGRFISIFLIVLLGAAFFAGIRSAKYDMSCSADRYYDDYKMMDFRIVSTVGLTDEDLEEIRTVEGVELAAGGHTAEALTQIEDKEYTVRLIGITEGVNEIYLSEGRLPESPRECVVDDYYAKRYHLKTGDVISLHGDTGQELEDSISEDTFTIVGMGKLSYYTDLTRGSGSIGNGSISFWMAIAPDVFTQEVYTEAYVRMKDAQELNCYGDAYEELAHQLERRLSDLGEVACHRRYNQLTQELDQAREELAEAEEKLADTKQQIQDGWKQVQEAEQELTQKEAELADAVAQYEAGVSQLADAKVQYAAGLNTYTTGMNQYNDGLAQYQVGLAEYQAGLAEYNARYAEYQAGLPAYNEALGQYEDGLSQYNSGMALYQAGYASLQTGESNYQLLLSQIRSLQERVDAGTATEAERALLDSLRSAEGSYRAELDKDAQELAATKAQLDEAKTQLDAFVPIKNQMESARLQLESAKAQLDNSYQILSVTKEQLDLSGERLKSAKEDLSDGEQEIADGEKELEEAADQIQEGQTALAEGRAQLEEKKQELTEGEAEYQESLPEAEASLAEAREQIAEGEEQLAGLDIPEWYVLGRDMITSWAGHKADADRMQSLGTVFPVIFFLVAALVSLTAMTRMIEEQRVQIGTLKALGYGDGVIICKYLGYALCAALLGSVLGSLLGGKLLPYVIMYAYQILYTGLPYIDLPMDVSETLLSIAASVLCIAAATLAACWKQLKTNPAQLMRPKPPKSGKRVLLERLPFLWKHLSFNQKTTLRNLFRYKKRIFMTIFGIGGCMSLLLVGYGLQDSITQVAKRQYTEIFRNDASITLNSNDSDQEQQELRTFLESYEGMESMLEVCMQSVTLETSGHSKTAYLYIPQDIEAADDFLNLQNRVTRKEYSYPTEGVALSEKTARDLKVGVGDTVTLKLGDEKAVSVTVESIAENYVAHYIFMGPSLYRDLFGREPSYNQLQLRYADTSEAYEDQLASELMRQEGCQGVSFTTKLEKQIGDMLESLNIIILVLIIAAGSLALVVLYNLNNINITERRRELATLKVLGFYDLEVAANVYRENVLLTLLGVIAGLFLGTALHQFTIQTVEVEMMMFGRTISVGSYAISSLITIGFSVIINGVMFFELKKIDMIESLKSVE